jgi:uncharacterized protein YeaO (DUF488 family)
MITHTSVYDLRNLSLEEREKLGCVVLVMRRWPRGIRHSYLGRSIVDYWLKEAGPSLALLRTIQHGDQEGHILSWEAFVQRYRQEQHAQSTCTPVAYQVDTGEQKGTPVTINTSPIGFLAELETRYGAVCCVCHEDLTKPGNHCHRTVLVQLVRDAQAGER